MERLAVAGPSGAFILSVQADADVYADWALATRSFHSIDCVMRTHLPECCTDLLVDLRA